MIMQRRKGKKKDRRMDGVNKNGDDGTRCFLSLYTDAVWNGPPIIINAVLGND